MYYLFFMIAFQTDSSLPPEVTFFLHQLNNSTVCMYTRSEGHCHVKETRDEIINDVTLADVLLMD